jgi:APA family basic amino acid/polyamine antiporter
VIQTGTIAAVAVAFAKFLGVLVPSLSAAQPLLVWGRFSVGPPTLVAIGVLGLLTWSNATGLRTGKVVQNVFTLTKIAALVGLVGLGLFVGANATAIQANFSDWWTASFTQIAPLDPRGFTAVPLRGWALLVALGTAMVGSLFSADAWNNITFTAGEVKEPQRNLPLSLVLGVGLVSLVYFLANVAYLMVLPLQGAPDGPTALARGIPFATQDRVGTAAAEIIFGPPAAALMAGLVMVSTFGCINGMVLAGARVYYAMAQDDLFFAPVGRLNRRGVPRNGLLVQCVWACLLTLSGTYGDLLDYVIFAVLVFYALTIGGLFVLRRTQPEAPRPYRALGYPVLPGLYVVAASLIALDLLISPKTRGNTWPGLLIVLAGVPVYYVWRRGRRAAERRA